MHAGNTGYLYSGHPHLYPHLHPHLYPHLHPHAYPTTGMFTNALDLLPNWEEGHFAYAQFLDEVCIAVSWCMWCGAFVMVYVVWCTCNGVCGVVH